MDQFQPFIFLQLEIHWGFVANLYLVIFVWSSVILNFVFMNIVILVKQQIQRKPGRARTSVASCLKSSAKCIVKRSKDTTYRQVQKIIREIFTRHLSVLSLIIIKSRKSNLSVQKSNDLQGLSVRRIFTKNWSSFLKTDEKLMYPPYSKRPCLLNSKEVQALFVGILNGELIIVFNNILDLMHGDKILIVHYFAFLDTTV